MKEDEVSVGIKGGIFLFKRERGLLKPPWNDLRFTYFSGYTCTWKVGLGGRDCFLVHYRGGGETEEGEGGTGGLRYQGHLTWNIEFLEKKIYQNTVHITFSRNLFSVVVGKHRREQTSNMLSRWFLFSMMDSLLAGGGICQRELEEERERG